MHQPKRRRWGEKFRDAFRGLRQGVHGQSSFTMHFVAAAAVIVAAIALGIDDRLSWCLLLLCIAVVLAAEMFNSALESLARAITDDIDPHIGRALNIGSAAVLIAAAGAAIVGTIVFVGRLGTRLAWW